MKKFEELSKNELRELYYNIQNFIKVYPFNYINDAVIFYNIFGLEKFVLNNHTKKYINCSIYNSDMIK